MSKLEECDSLMKIPSLLSLEMAEVEGNKHETDVIKESDEFHTNHNSTPSSYEVNSQLNEDETEPEMNNCSRITPGSTRSRESIFITEAFSFLPQEDANENEVDSKSEVTVSSGESELDSLATGAEDGDLANGGENDAETTIDGPVLDQGSATDTTILRNQNQTVTEHCSSSISDSKDGLRATRLISMEFKFLSSDQYNPDNKSEAEMLSTLQENEDEQEDEAGIVDTKTDSDGDLSINNPAVVMRQKSVISSQGPRPSDVSNESSVNSESDDDDDDLCIEPGAWRKSKFMYLNDASDTASEGSVTDSPHLSSSPKHFRCLSIYPPKTLDSKDDDDDDDDDDELTQQDDLEVFQSDIKRDTNQPPPTERSDSPVSTTVTEHEFRSRYRSLKKTRILRKASTRKDSANKEQSVIAVSREVFLQMEEGETEFGFHIWEHKPMIVSTIEEGTAADRAGLRVGDVLLKLNKIDISEASLNEVIQIIGKGSRHVTLGLAEQNQKLELPLFCGYLSKQGSSMLVKKWKRRWVELKPDHCLYYYKTKWDVDPLGAVPVVNYIVAKATELKNPFAFKLTKFGARTYYFIADSETEMSRWAEAIKQAGEVQNEDNVWLDISSHNVSLPALSIRRPECYGYLYKMGNSNKVWRRRYCVLKDGCLYYYENLNSCTAKGVAHFHGYTVENSLPYNKQFGFMLIPPDKDMRTFYLYAENETEMKRWLTAFIESLSKWVKASEYE